MAAEGRSVGRPQGPLPARVYWFRRVLVLATVLALVFAVARLIAGGGDDPAAAPDRAAPAAVRTPASSPTAEPTPQPQMFGPVPVTPPTTTGVPSPTGTPVLLAEPTGPCTVDEVTVTPSVPEPVAGSPVKVALRLTGIRPACTFVVSARSVVVKVTSGKDRIWSTQDCRGAIPRSTVTVRSSEPVEVPVTWSGRRSDADCSRATTWALPGYYHVAASAIGSEPSDVQVRLSAPARPVVTKTAKPKPKKQKKQAQQNR